MQFPLLYIIAFFLSVQVFANPDPTLVGGKPVKAGEYPEVIRISDGGSYCSAALIGPRVILTAAHCTRENGDIEPVSEKKIYEFVHNQNVYKAKCTLAPSYRDGRRGVGSQDIALCKTDKSIDVKYAVITENEPAIDQTVTLIGYGCTRGRDSEGGPGGGNDGILRVGKAKVSRSSTDNSYHWYADRGAYLCFGDSGGPAFLEIKKPKDEIHYVAGVNSMGNIRSYSLLTSVPRSMQFLKAYEMANNVEICGVSRNCGKSQQECITEMDDLKLAVKSLDQCLSDMSSLPIPVSNFVHRP